MSSRVTVFVRGACRYCKARRVCFETRCSCRLARENGWGPLGFADPLYRGQS